MTSRIAGVTLPLSSIRTDGDWGIGEIGALPACGAWLATGGFRLLQLLPPYELARGETSPYGARTGFGLDPIYLSIEALPEADAALVESALGTEGLAERARLHGLNRVDYTGVRALKMKVLEKAFAQFVEREWKRDSPRAKELRAFREREAAWEDDLALYVALREEHQEHSWEIWEMPLRLRDPQTLAEARTRLESRILFHGYLQWQLWEQWSAAKSALEKQGMLLMGDLPFVVCRESSDVWAHTRLFQRDMSLGAPPDGFTPEGQDWGLPPYAWAELAQQGHAWLRARARHASRLYHAFRVDHVVGYFRQYVRKPGKLGTFDPVDEAQQAKHGRVVLEAMIDAARGSEIIAEDLGVIPPFARKVMTDLRLPGYKVLPWEKDKKEALLSPETFPVLSVATWSTHDTAPLKAWWPELPAEDRTGFLALAKLSADLPWEKLEEGLLRLLFSATSQLALVLAPEVLGEDARINTPGVVGQENWTYRLPKSLEGLGADPAVRARMERFRSLLAAARRT